MNKAKWVTKCKNKNEAVSIKTDGGYTFEQIMDNKNCSKDEKYWVNIDGTDKFLFRSKTAESWEFFDNDIVNPIRNTNQIYIRILDLTEFTKTANYFRKHKVYTHTAPNTPAFVAFWTEEERKCLEGVLWNGVYITGRYYFLINFGFFKAIPVDEDGEPVSKNKKVTLLRFVDLQYYLFHELEECWLSGNYNSKAKFLEWFPLRDSLDYIDLAYEFFVAAKGRRKGWSASVGSGGIAYNFIFIPESKNIIGAEEKSHYKPIQKGIKDTLNAINKHTPWKRPLDIKGQANHFITGVKHTMDDGTIIEEGYKSEVEYLSFPDPFKGIGDSADLLNVEEPGKFKHLLATLQVSIEPVLREGNSPIGACVLGGCVCKGTEVYNANRDLIKIEDVSKDDKLISVNNSIENISWIKPISKKQCYRITTIDGNSIDCSYDHPLMVYDYIEEDGTQIITFKRVSDIDKGDSLVTTTPYDKGCIRGVFKVNAENGKGYLLHDKELTNLENDIVDDIIDLGMQDVYNLTADTTHTYISNGFISSNTAGDLESGGSSALQELMYKPDAYRFKSYQNIYEKTPLETKSGWFIDDLWFLTDTQSKKKWLEIDNSPKTMLYLDHFKNGIVKAVDKYGNSYRYLANLLLNKKREEKRQTSSEAYQKFITQQPKYLAEAFLLDSTSPFDIGLAQEALGKLMSKENTIPMEKGFFVDGDTVKGVTNVIWKKDFSLQVIDRYPWKGDSKEGGWIIYSHPVKSYKPSNNMEDILNPGIPKQCIDSGRYIAGTDPIDWGSGETSSNSNAHSLAATWILDTYTRGIVAVYISRPYKSDMYFESLRKGLEYYNATCNPETNIKGIITYFKTKNKSYLLCNELTSLKDKLEMNRSKNPMKGTKASPRINNAARELIHRWSTEEVVIGQDDDGENVTTPRMFTIPSVLLLQEIIAWNISGNFDGVSGLGMALLMLFDNDYAVIKPNKQVEDRLTTGIFKSQSNKIKLRNNHTYAKQKFTFR